MSEFLMIVPPGWVEVQDGQAFVDTHTEAQLMDLIQSNQYDAIEARLQDYGYIPMEAKMLDFRMLRDGDIWRIWVNYTTS